MVTTVPSNPERIQAAKPVLFITYGFPPSMEMGAQSCAQIARYLPLHGWKPIVLTVKDKYIEKAYLGHSVTRSDEQGLAEVVVKTRVLPHFFDFYRWGKSLLSSMKSRSGWSNSPTVADETANAREESPKGSVRSFVLSLLNVPDMHTGWLIPGMMGGLRAIRENEVEVIFSSSPFFTGHLIGHLLARLTSLPWVIHFRDPTVGPPYMTNKSIPVRLRLALERMVVKRADRVVCVTKEHAALMREAYPECASEKFLAVPNGFDAEEWEEIAREQEKTAHNVDKSKDQFVLLYAGQIYVERSPEPVFRALCSLIDSGDISREEVRFELIGWCQTSKGRSVADLVEEMDLQDCVSIPGPKSRRETLQRMTQANLLVLLAEGWTVQIPGKTYEYLKAGHPILALTSEGALADFIRNTNCGWSIDPSDHEAIRSAVLEAYTDWKAGRIGHLADPATVAGFDRRQTTRQLGELFDQLIVRKGIHTSSANDINLARGNANHS
jgi:glycosyltransferase involved in cell wall biosynthesis